MLPNKKHILTSQEAISKEYFLFLLHFHAIKKYIKIKEMEGVFAYYAKGSSTIKRDDALKVNYKSN